MIHRPRARHKRRNFWSSLLAVLLGVLSGASAFAFNNNVTGGLSASEHVATARTAGAPASLRSNTADPWLSFGGTLDDGAALPAEDRPTALWSDGPAATVAVAFDIPGDVSRTRDGRTRAPPSA